MFTIANGIPSLAANLQRLQEFISLYIQWLRDSDIWIIIIEGIVMRKDSIYFLKKMLEYRDEIGKDFLCIIAKILEIFPI